MASTLILSSKLLSLWDQRWIHDEHGVMLYESSRPKMFGRTVELKNPAGVVVATIDPQTWKSRPTWEISTANNNYAIVQNIKSYQRFYQISAGPFDGVIIEGGDFDQQFRIRLGDEILAQASEEMFSLTSKHVVNVLVDNEDIQILSAVVGIILVKEKQKSRTKQSQNNH